MAKKLFLVLASLAIAVLIASSFVAEAASPSELVGKKFFGNWYVSTPIDGFWSRSLEIEILSVDLKRRIISLRYSLSAWERKPHFSENMEAIPYTEGENGEIGVDFNRPNGDSAKPLHFRFYTTNGEWKVSGIGKGRDPRATIMCTLTTVP